MPATTITLGGNTLWSNASTGFAWAIASITSPQKLVNEVPSPLGVGFWVKPAGVSTGQIALDLMYTTNAPSTLRATVNGFASNESLQTLVGPEPIGTLPNCRIASIDGWEFQPIGGGYFFAKVSVSFTQYP